MHRKFWNSLCLSFIIKPCGPLLVKSGMVSANPSLPDMQFVRTSTPEGETVFLPGSSLKGVFRSFTEKVLRTITKDDICDILDKKENCVKKKQLQEYDNTAKVYKESCLACKMYGNTRLRGRIAFTDAFPEGSWKTEIRYGVAISRLTSAVAVGPFDMEVLVEGNFSGFLVLENFEIWQLALLGFTIRSLNDGLVRIGFGKSRGFGEVHCEITEAVFTMARRDISKDKLWGVGAFASAEEREAYGLREDDLLSGVPEGNREDFGVYTRVVYRPEEWKDLLKIATQVATRFLHLEGSS
ncbi:MAG: RAMP superfamily CRISPR-associated protein [Candidatus Caldatribacterium sp.]|nr:RAMP superfamily CRISPR-associated protein [Candidatus Caldatribacterium sp.]